MGDQNAEANEEIADHNLNQMLRTDPQGLNGVVSSCRNIVIDTKLGSTICSFDYDSEGRIGRFFSPESRVNPSLEYLGKANVNEFGDKRCIQGIQMEGIAIIRRVDKEGNILYETHPPEAQLSSRAGNIKYAMMQYNKNPSIQASMEDSERNSRNKLLSLFGL